MATTNYSLPTLDNTALFDLVTDYNALANATDAALASVAGLVPTETITEMQGQISALQTLTGSQGSQITALQSQMSTANGNISTVQSGLDTANSNIGTLQTGLQSANTKIDNINNAFVLSSKTYNSTAIHANALSASYLTVMVNSAGSIINITGRVQFDRQQTRVAIPGASGYYGIKTLIRIPSITKAHTFDCSGVVSQDGAAVASLSTAFAIGSDGYIYLYYGSSTTTSNKNAMTINIINSIRILGTPVEFTGA
jgi:X-X-X-Leu-X-X-Gly heptad repeat protein